jgi:hypothetical protein
MKIISAYLLLFRGKDCSKNCHNSSYAFRRTRQGRTSHTGTTKEIIEEDNVMKEYYKDDNDLVLKVIEYFGLMKDGKVQHKEFEIGGEKWICQNTGYETNTDGSIPDDRRIEGEVILTLSDGTKHPSIRLDISVGSGT